MADDSMTVTIHGKENMEWLRAQVAEGRFASESEAVSECLSMLREDELDFMGWEQEVVAQRHAEYMANPSMVLTDEQVGESLARARRERDERAA